MTRWALLLLQRAPNLCSELRAKLVTLSRAANPTTAFRPGRAEGVSVITSFSAQSVPRLRFQLLPTPLVANGPITLPAATLPFNISVSPTVLVPIT